ncbi:MAG TPA: glycoside hydrolase family 172 protein [Terracidiphilus sp.]|nr:glycoside hydrolase family 172 protein [Terracidiphilus sp.]
MDWMDASKSFRGRRKLLGTLAGGISAAALLGAQAPAAVAAPAERESTVPEELFALARLRNYKNRRSSSWDRSGGNADWVTVEPGQSATIFEVSGAGVVTHIWFTISSPDSMHLKNLVLRAWWDGESSPSVEAPIGDFFGLGLGEYFVYQSELLAVAPIKALNAYFEMPFSTAARMTVTNEGKMPTRSLYFAIDYVTLPSLPDGLGRFHAQYRQSNPCKGISSSGKNLNGQDNYVFMEATGRGHFVGVTHAVLQNQNGWFGEGDDMIFIDGDTTPTINGTGSEDYYNGAWDFGGQPFGFQHNGAPYVVDPERIGGRYCLYRWHTESPIAFEKSIRVTIEHGAANDRADSFCSTAYWYQTEPHAAFPALPAAADRILKVYAVGGNNGPAPLPGS